MTVVFPLCVPIVFGSARPTHLAEPKVTTWEKQRRQMAVQKGDHLLPKPTHDPVATYRSSPLR